jgi:hypothetical protein
MKKVDFYGDTGAGIKKAFHCIQDILFMRKKCVFELAKKLIKKGVRGDLS